MEQAQRKILSMDDIRAGLSEMAENGEGAQRAQAYRMLMNMESATVTLPTPLNLEERRDRYQAIMNAMGREETHVIYQRCWPNAKSKPSDPPKFTLDHMPAKVRYTAMQIKSLPKLYRTFPEMKPKGGFPTGYPVGYGKVSQARWCQQTAAKILLDRMQEEATPEKDAPTPQTENPVQAEGALAGS